MEPRRQNARTLVPRAALPPFRIEATPQFAVFTTFDGTLLNAPALDVRRSKSALRRLLAAGVSVIPFSAAALEDVLPLAGQLGIRSAVVAERGGVVAWWRENRFLVEPLGPPAESLLDAIAEIEDRSGASLLLQSAAEEISPSTSGDSATSYVRRFSEPFIIERGSFEAVAQAAADLGLSLERHRKLLHLCRPHAFAEAFTRVRKEIGCQVAVGVGNAVHDADFLTLSEIPIILPGPDGHLEPHLRASVPHARVAPAPGAAGWMAAVEEVWQSLAIQRARR